MHRSSVSLVAALVALAGCDQLLGTGKPLPLTSPDGTARITVNTSWKADGQLNKQAVLSASNRFKELYVIVLVDEKSALEEQTVQHYADFTRGLLARSLKDVKEQPGVKLQVRGRDAYQTRLRGRLDSADIVYLHTAIETPTRFYQVVAWTLESRADKNLPRLAEVVGSFEELAPRR
jgi:hypothetical protein